MHLKISIFNPTLKLSISINFNCYLKRKCYTPINGSNNCAQYATWLTVTAFINYMTAAVAFTRKSCYYHFKIISIYSANSEAEQDRVTFCVTYCIAARQLITVQQSTLAVRKYTVLWRIDWYHVIFCNHEYIGGFFKSWGIFLTGMLI